MTDTPVFIDTNVFVYALDRRDLVRHDRALQLSSSTRRVTGS